MKNRVHYTPNRKSLVKFSPRISLKIYPVNSGKAVRVTTTKSKRIYFKVTHEKFLKVYLKTTYGKDCSNEGVYENRKDLLQALDAFLEVKDIFAPSNSKHHGAGSSDFVVLPAPSSPERSLLYA